MQSQKISLFFLLFPPQLCTCEFPSLHWCPPPKAAFFKHCQEREIWLVTCAVWHRQRKHDMSTNYWLSRALSLLCQCRAACVTNYFGVRTCRASSRWMPIIRQTPRNRPLHLYQTVTHTYTGAGQRKMERKSPIMLLQQKCNAAPWWNTAQQLLSSSRKHIFASLYIGCRSFATASFRPTTCTVSQNECDKFRGKFQNSAGGKHIVEKKEGRK